MFLLTLESPQTLRAARRGIQWMREHYRRPPEPQRLAPLLDGVQSVSPPRRRSPYYSLECHFAPLR